MTVRRVSIVGMMSFVLVAAVGLAALRNANEAWAGLMLLLTLGALGVSVLGVVHREGEERAWWLGFALFGSGYALLAFGPWFAEEVRPALGTTLLLNYVHTRAIMSPVPQSATLANARSQYQKSLIRYQQVKRMARSANDLALARAAAQVELLASKLQAIQGYAPPGAPSSTSGSTPPPANRLLVLMPGAGNYEQFLRVGHSLFALLAGLLGAIVSLWFRRTRRAAGLVGA
jgi:hypothetical protein